MKKQRFWWNPLRGFKARNYYLHLGWKPLLPLPQDANMVYEKMLVPLTWKNKTSKLKKNKQKTPKYRPHTHTHLEQNKQNVMEFYSKEVWAGLYSALAEFIPTISIFSSTCTHALVPTLLLSSCASILPQVKALTPPYLQYLYTGGKVANL